MELYQIIRISLLIILAILIATCVIANIKTGRQIGDSVILALISAMVAVYTFVL